MMRAQKNITQGREHISPFYHPDEEAFRDPIYRNEVLDNTEQLNPPDLPDGAIDL